MAANFISAPSANANGANGVYTLTSQCGSEGAAMYDPLGSDSVYPWPKSPFKEVVCWRMTAHPIIIGPSFMSQMQAFQTVNFDFNTNGDQPAVPNALGLPGWPAIA